MAENTTPKRLTRSISSIVDFNGHAPSFDLLITQFHGEISATLAQSSPMGIEKEQGSTSLKRKEMLVEEIVEKRRKFKEGIPKKPKANNTSKKGKQSVQQTNN
ncbi:hypothetical protein HAX54_052826 [Datura stramonium]|uniref:Uncharacterized protein n=1 Tax=Datura stramonium TaxID=4076 RepID=A0ABS8T1R0_DATST|nr:hypothetical protein [Datura stramonium]